MNNLELVIGTKRFSSWSLRPWVALKQAQLPFTETVIELRRPETGAEIAKHSPSGKIPVLKHGALVVWDSLSICEYVAELACAHSLWPENRGALAVARSVSAEMHSGFVPLRQTLPMDSGHDIPDFTPTAEAQADIERIQAIWRDCRQRFGANGDFLFGRWSMADAMFAPVVFRFESYRIPQDDLCQAYMQAMLALPAMQQWRVESL
jgi:glutathione S-transferase